MFLAARADRDARILRLVLERVGRTVGAALVEPQVVALRVRSAGFLEARLVDEPQVVPAVVPVRVVRLLETFFVLGSDRGIAFRVIR